MRAVVHVLAMAAAIAGIVHISSVLLLPAYAERDAWALIAGSAPAQEMRLVTEPWSAPSPGSPPQLRIDPSFAVAVCRFDLSEGPVAVEAEGDIPFWSASVFDQAGRNLFSINDRTAIENRLDVVILDERQRAQLKETPVTGIEGSIQVVSTLPTGFVVLRAAAPDRTRGEAATTFVRGAECSRLTIEDS